DVSFEAAAGEIVGITGILGSGASELAETLVGLRRPGAGALTLHARRYKPRHPADALARGVVLVPRGRRHDGIDLEYSPERTLLLSPLGRDSRSGFLSAARSRRRAQDLIERLDIRPADPDAVTGRLSGGNQQ